MDVSDSPVQHFFSRVTFEIAPSDITYPLISRYFCETNQNGYQLLYLLRLKSDEMLTCWRGTIHKKQGTGGQASFPVIIDNIIYLRGAEGGT